MHRAEADGQAVPDVDGADGERQVHLLLLREVLLQQSVVRVGRRRLGHQRQRLGPGQRRPLALAVERRLAPGREQVEAGLALAGLAGVIGGNYLVTDPAMAVQMGPIVFVVVVVGGIGSLEGAFLASLLIGLLQNFAVGISASFGEIFGFLGLSTTSELGSITISSLAPMLPFLLLVLMLIFRPRGLMGEQEL